MSVPKTAILRRTSFVTDDADRIARFYEDVFGWSRFYDNETEVDARFPPCAPDAALARLIILKAQDPDIGMVGFMEYVGFSPEVSTDKDKTRLGIGDPILVVESHDIDGTYERVKKTEARLVSEPINWSVKNYAGDGLIYLKTFSFFDPIGTYVEVNIRLDGPPQKT
ncbi:MAG TPA: hypothetical protein ENK01_04805 [Hellea balneolensis]|uniref:VOC domain-containing protein n=1 Tax=Hellea balneolensis TaxID=287478 RepID=A0A7V5NY95_9PROT|nr:hypothetical protein [Hellea balneolensis]